VDIMHLDDGACYLTRGIRW